MTDSTLDRMAIFDRMLVMRHFEEAVIRLYNDKRFAGHYHVYIGQEATGAAVLDQLGPDDLVLTTHRNHGHVVGRDSDPGRALAEILGRATGFNHGKGGTLHISDRANGFLSTSAVVGGCAGLAIGAAHGLKINKSKGVAVGFFGDGSLEEGLVIESFNIAALWKLPVIFVCENNSAGAMGPQKGGYPTAITAAALLSRIPQSFGIETQVVDGTDMAAVHAAAQTALGRARQGQGPTFIEAVTRRWPGSSPLWPELATVTDVELAWDTARISGPHADWIRDCDPILRAAREMAEAGRPRAAIMARDTAARQRIEQAIAFALDSPMPDPATALAGVFALASNPEVRP
ncbi:MAG: thiamine pyrophosphate-dependent dehydrogenase E1 component subunit alpha [Rhodospirillales bacterium]|nr:thiamine pyrophosphate-dependent dehydrogenase E1 component subunit alpha [Rhodospirillales bacterium]